MTLGTAGGRDAGRGRAGAAGAADAQLDARADGGAGHPHGAHGCPPPHHTRNPRPGNRIENLISKIKGIFSSSSTYPKQAVCLWPCARVVCLTGLCPVMLHLTQLQTIWAFVSGSLLREAGVRMACKTKTRCSADATCIVRASVRGRVCRDARRQQQLVRSRHRHDAFLTGTNWMRSAIPSSASTGAKTRPRISRSSCATL